MSFAVSADAYDAFMGRFSRPLAVPFADLLDLAPGSRVLDVGAGPGAFSSELVHRVGAGAVTAVDPMADFVAALTQRLPGVTGQVAAAEQLPFDDDTFDAAAAQLVVHFMQDPVAGVSEMARVTRPSGQVAACVWDHAGDGSPLSLFWQAARDLDPDVVTESALAGASEGSLASIFDAAGLLDVASGRLEVAVTFGSFDDWWQPFTLGVGPAGVHVTALSPAGREALAARCAEMLGPGPFTVRAAAWSAVGVASPPGR